MILICLGYGLEFVVFLEALQCPEHLFEYGQCFELAVLVLMFSLETVDLSEVVEPVRSLCNQKS